MSRRPLSFPGLRPKAEADRSRAKQRMDELLRRAEADRQEGGPVVPLSAAAELDLAFAPPEGALWDDDLEPEMGREWARAASLDEAPAVSVGVDVDEEAWPADSPWPDDEDGIAALDEMPLDWIAEPVDAGLTDAGLTSEPPIGEIPVRPAGPSAASLEAPAVGRAAARAVAAQDATPEASPKKAERPRLLRGRFGTASESDGGRKSVLSFRRPGRRRVRRLRRHPLVRLLRPLASALLILAVPASVVAWFLAAPSFALKGVAVQEDSLGRVDGDWVRGALAEFEGANIWLLPLAQVEGSLKRHPWVGDVALRKLPPDGLAVQIVERREAALYRSDEGLVYVDSTGRRIAPWQSVQGMGDLPILSGRGDAEHLAGAVALMEEIYAAGPAWAPGLSEVEILSELDFRLHTRDLPFPLLVRAGTVDAKAQYLQAILPRILDRFETVKAVDLRFARRIIIEPVAQDPRRS